MTFKPYTKDDEAVALYVKFYQAGNERDLLSDEDLPGTLNNVAALRAKVAEGATTEDEVFGETVVNTDIRRETAPLLIEQLQKDVESMKEEETTPAE